MMINMIYIYSVYTLYFYGSPEYKYRVLYIRPLLYRIKRTALRTFLSFNILPTSIRASFRREDC